MMMCVLFILFGSAGFAAQDNVNDFDIPQKWAEGCNAVVPTKRWEARNAEKYGLARCAVFECRLNNALSLYNKSECLYLRFNKSANFFHTGLIFSITMHQKDADDYMHWSVESQGFYGDRACLVIKASEGEEPDKRCLPCDEVVPPLLSCQYEFGESSVIVSRFLGDRCDSKDRLPSHFLRFIIDYNNLHNIRLDMCSDRSSSRFAVFACNWGAGELTPLSFDIPKQWEESVESVVPAKVWKASNAEKYGLEMCDLYESGFSDTLSLRNKLDIFTLCLNKSANLFDKGEICSIRVSQKDSEEYINWSVKSQGVDCDNRALIVIETSENDEPYEDSRYCDDAVPSLLSCGYEFGASSVMVRCFLCEERDLKGGMSPRFLLFTIDYNNFRKIPVYMCAPVCSYRLSVCEWSDA